MKRIRKNALRFWYAIARALVRAFIFAFFSLEVEGLENIPDRSGVIVAGNHSSYMDVPIIGAVCSRQVHFMGKKSLFKFAPLRILFKSLGSFPVDREKIDRKALSTALECLKCGEVLGIFPQGTRGEVSDNGKEGVSWLSLRSSCPIVPVGIRGTSGIFPWGFLSRRKVLVRFGSPIYPHEFSTAKRSGPNEGRAVYGDGTTVVDKGRVAQRLLTKQLMKQIKELSGQDEDAVME